MGYAQPKDPLCAVASPEELVWLARMCMENGYTAPTPMGNGEYLALHRLLFHWTMIHGAMFDDCGYIERWCYQDYPTALGALYLWKEAGFEGEPIGWHRHPKTGRRRPGGDPEQEYVDP